MWSADETNEPLGSLLAHWSLAAASLQGEVGSDDDQKADDRPADTLQHSSREYGLDGDYSGNQEHRPRQVPSASHATDADPSQWSRVNAQLERCGFERIRVRGEGQMIRGASAGEPGGTSLLETLEQVLEAHESRRERLEESIRETALAAQRAVQAEYHARIAQAGREEAERGRAQTEAQLVAVKAQHAKAAAEGAACTRSLEAALKSTRQKCAIQAQLLRSRDSELQRMQDKLLREVEGREAARTARQRQVFEEVLHRAPRPQSAVDAKQLELIGAYEAQVQMLASELELQRADNRRLAAQLVERENLIALKDATSSWRTPDASAALLDASATKAELERAQDELRRLGASTREKLAEMQARVGAAEQAASSARSRADELELASGGAPTLAQWAEAQRTIGKLRAQLSAMRSTCCAHGDARADARADALADASTRRRQDRTSLSTAAVAGGAAAGRPALQAGRKAPAQASSPSALLRECCAQLRLSDASVLPSALRKLCAALAALPAMEAWVRDVCALVPEPCLQGALLTECGVETDACGHDQASAVKSAGVPARALAELRRWAAAMCPSADGSQRPLLAVISKESDCKADCVSARPAGKSATGAENNPTRPRTPGGATVLDLTSGKASAPSDNATVWKDEAPSALSTEQLAPCAELRSIVSHYQQLFDVAALEGVLPSMNQLYVSVQEQRNFLRQLRLSIGVDQASSTHTLLDVLRSRLSVAHMAGAQAAEDSDGEVDAPAETELASLPPGALQDAVRKRKQLSGARSGRAAGTVAATAVDTEPSEQLASIRLHEHGAASSLSNAGEAGSALLDEHLTQGEAIGKGSASIACDLPETAEEDAGAGSACEGLLPADLAYTSNEGETGGHGDGGCAESLANHGRPAALREKTTEGLEDEDTAMELCKLLMVSSEADIVPAAHRLLSELEEHQQAHTSSLGLIQDLCEILSIGSAEALLPSILQLRRLSDTLPHANNRMAEP